MILMEGVMIKNIKTIFRYVKYKIVTLLFGDLIVTMSDDEKEPVEFKVTEMRFGDIVVYIYCKITHFNLKHDHWWIPDKRFVTYSMRGECTDNAGNKLKEILATVITLLDMGFDAGSDNITLDNAVRAYMSILYDILGKKTVK